MAADLGVVHKSLRGNGGPLCQPVRAGQANALIADNTTATSIYWDGVTCPRCLDLKPPEREMGGRTSVKRSHRAEGENFLD